jgi:hypothetical protein
MKSLVKYYKILNGVYGFRADDLRSSESVKTEKLMPCRLRVRA